MLRKDVYTLATFTNYATLRYGSVTVTSNTVTGTLPDALTLTKTAVTEDYAPGDVVSYLLSLVNPGTTDLTGLTVTDDLGAYAFGQGTVYPLAYTPGTLRLLVNGLPQATPAVAPGPPLVITGLTVPAGGTAVLAYEASLTPYAPLEAGSVITNTATVTGLTAPITASASVTPEVGPSLHITKDLTPATVRADGTVTYTFTLENVGNAPADAASAVVLEDLFQPALTGLTVTGNGTPWTSGVEYTYTEGLFATLPGALTLPAATYVQAADGTWTMTPGRTVVTVTGTIG